MSTWILVVWALGTSSGVAVTTVGHFETKAECEAAAKVVRESPLMMRTGGWCIERKYTFSIGRE